MRWIIGFFFASCLFFGGCEWGGKSYWLGKYEGHIKNGTRSIDSARSDTERAAGHDERARGYAEKARYSRVFKLIGAEEYGRLFDLAMKDHDEAVRLDSGNAEMYVSRGRTYYDRAAAAGQDDLDPKTPHWFDLAKADFTSAIERDGRHELARDMRGMIHEHNGDYQQAIDDYMQVMRSNPKLGRIRLADLYCERGSVRQREKKYDLAVADYQKSIELGAAADGCSCDPYAPLAWTYFDGLRQYDKSWEIVHKAQAHKRWIPPELLEQLKKASGKDR
jgi:tetratricopeptide (TPR) repeat protein